MPTTLSEQCRLVVVEITTSTSTHCSNKCRFMVTDKAGVCTLAGDYGTVELAWDGRKQQKKATKDQRAVKEKQELDRLFKRLDRNQRSRG